MIKISEKLAHSSNFSTKGRKTIRYIVMHFTANNGDTAVGNCNYFSGPNRNASAHYFVDENEIYRSVRDVNVAWHCGATRYVHGQCRNSNSIGVEMCSDKVNGQYVITKETVDKAAELVKYLMAKYDVPVENVLRHYDVTGKICPEPWVRDSSLWTEFKERLVDKMEKRYNSINELPEWAKPTIQKLIDKGAFSDVNKLDLTLDMIRIYVTNDRIGIYI